MRRWGVALHWAVVLVLAGLEVGLMIRSWLADPGLCDALADCSLPDCDPYACVGRNAQGAQRVIVYAVVEWVAASVALWPSGPARWARAVLVGGLAGLFSVPLLFVQIHGGPITLLHLLGLWAIMAVALVHGTVAIGLALVSVGPDPVAEESGGGLDLDNPYSS